MPGTNGVIECPKLLARLYPLSSEPVLGAVFPPQAKTTLLAALLPAALLSNVTVNVEFPLWFAVKVAEPLTPVPLVAKVRVPLGVCVKLL